MKGKVCSWDNKLVLVYEARPTERGIKYTIVYASKRRLKFVDDVEPKDLGELAYSNDKRSAETLESIMVIAREQQSRGGSRE